MDQIKWFDRKFNFEANQNIFPSILERLISTPMRLEAKFIDIPSEFLNVQAENKWSIKENIGHLADLEPLWQTRFEEIKNGIAELQAADLQNTKTHHANHNANTIEALLKKFILERQKTIDFIENIEEELVFKSSIHPRLKTPMRTMDLFLFVAEHDDHHLARISRIIKILKQIE